MRGRDGRLLNGRRRQDAIVDVLYALYKRKDMSEVRREALLDAMNEIAWDDAVHIAAPWETRSTLCGKWFRNMVRLDVERPDGMIGCWTCLMAAKWFDEHRIATLAVPPPKPIIGPTRQPRLP